MCYLQSQYMWMVAYIFYYVNACVKEIGKNVPFWYWKNNPHNPLHSSSIFSYINFNILLIIVNNVQSPFSFFFSFVFLLVFVWYCLSCSLVICLTWLSSSSTFHEPYYQILISYDLVHTFWVFPESHHHFAKTHQFF